MRSSTFVAVLFVLGAFSFCGARSGAQVKTAVQLQNQPVCLAVGCGGGPGHGGGGTPPPSYTLNFSSPANDPGLVVGGAPQRFGVGAVVFKGSLYVAWTSNQTFDSRGDANVYVASSTSGGPDYYPFPPSPIVSAQGVTITAAGNPALAVLNGVLYLGVVDGYGGATFITSTDGTTWGSYAGCGTGYTGSATMAAFNGSMYMALENAADQSLTLCKIPNQATTPGATPTTQNFPEITQNFVAGLGVYTPPGGVATLYIAYATNQNSHNIYYYTTTDGVNFLYSTAAAGDQSSTTISLASHNNVLYMAFRSNDGGHNLLYKYSTDGVSWSSYIDVSGNQTGGPPTLVTSEASPTTAVDYLSGPLSGTAVPGDLFNLYVSNDSSQVLWTQYTP
jgi:hypothetical protein